MSGLPAKLKVLAQLAALARAREEAVLGRLVARRRTAESQAEALKQHGMRPTLPDTGEAEPAAAAAFARFHGWSVAKRAEIARHVAAEAPKLEAARQALAQSKAREDAIATLSNRAEAAVRKAQERREDEAGATDRSCPRSRRQT